MMNDHHSMMAAENIRCACYDITIAATRPSVLYRPALQHWVFPDERGTYWTARYGDITCKGETPALAMARFDTLWQEAK